MAPIPCHMIDYKYLAIYSIHKDLSCKPGPPVDKHHRTVGFHAQWLPESYSSEYGSPSCGLLCS